MNFYLKQRKRSNLLNKLVQRRWMTGDRFSMEIREFLSRQRQTLLSGERAPVETATAWGEMEKKKKKESADVGRVYQSFKMVQQNWKIVLYFRERRACVEHVYMDKYLYRVDGFVYKWQLFRIRYSVSTYTQSRSGKGRNWGFYIKKKFVRSIFHSPVIKRK